jgi:uncharacterized protein YndB with AHSA1/START domain
MENFIAVETQINKSVDKIWELWTNSKHIVNWYFASEDWHCPFAENDLRIEGKFSFRMESKDGKEGFNFWGNYTEIILNKSILYTAGDGRKVRIEFEQTGETTKIVEMFEPENENSKELQKLGWQSILNNFKKYSESISDV